MNELTAASRRSDGMHDYEKCIQTSKVIPLAALALEKVTDGSSGWVSARSKLSTMAHRTYSTGII